MLTLHGEESHCTSISQMVYVHMQSIGYIGLSYTARWVCLVHSIIFAKPNETLTLVYVLAMIG